MVSRKLFTECLVESKVLEDKDFSNFVKIISKVHISGIYTQEGYDYITGACYDEQYFTIVVDGVIRILAELSSRGITGNIKIPAFDTIYNSDMLSSTKDVRFNKKMNAINDTAYNIIGLLILYNAVDLIENKGDK